MEIGGCLIHVTKNYYLKIFIKIHVWMKNIYKNIKNII